MNTHTHRFQEKLQPSTGHTLRLTSHPGEKGSTDTSQGSSRQAVRISYPSSPLSQAASQNQLSVLTSVFISLYLVSEAKASLKHDWSFCLRTWVVHFQASNTKPGFSSLLSSFNFFFEIFINCVYECLSEWSVHHRCSVKPKEARRRFPRSRVTDGWTILWVLGTKPVSSPREAGAEPSPQLYFILWSQHVCKDWPWTQYEG